MKAAIKPRARKAGNESALVTAILKALKMKGVWCWRVNSGLTVFKAQAGHARRVVKGAEPGTPDILLVLPRSWYWLPRDADKVESVNIGRLCGLEVKTKTGKQSESQELWEAKAEHHGVGYAVVRGVGEALRQVEVWSGKGGGQ